MFVLKVSKQLGTIYLLKSLYSFLPSFDIAILSLIWYEALSLDVKGTGMGHRIVMIVMLRDVLAFLFEGLRSF